MQAFALSLLLTALLLALPVMTWTVFKTRRGQRDYLRGKTSLRLLAACTIAAWGAQALRYALLATAHGAIEVWQAAQLSAPLGWLVWLAGLTGVAAFSVFCVKKRRVSKNHKPA
jgi:hypothetical protein